MSTISPDGAVVIVTRYSPSLLCVTVTAIVCHCHRYCVSLSPLLCVTVTAIVCHCHQ